jgi:proton-translocating NAD(P)+ transhydrogenase subunit alpha
MTHQKQTVVGVPKETYPGETLVALISSHAPLLTKIGLQVLVESGAGEAAGFDDEAYRVKGAQVARDRPALFGDGREMVQAILNVLKEG